jgi:uncharacterized membrane protein YbaN (DUF454 family)
MTDHRDDFVPTATRQRSEAVTKWGRVFSRPFLLAVGWFMVGLGMVGVVVPGLPTVPFLLVALWAFSKSSQRFHDWLYTHKRLGPPLRDWREHGVIPFKAKVLAIATMLVSLAWITFGIAENWVLPTVVAACLIPPALFIVTRPGKPKI